MNCVKDEAARGPRSEHKGLGREKPAAEDHQQLRAERQDWEYRMRAHHGECVFPRGVEAARRFGYFIQANAPERGQ